ncbi:hypothetical protein L228DRAFT_266455 [Xylona heveae TC161]|uniref:Uncharacterized protein n=1 Tax=Xylona heveae (strain CBS 132557 / TC161) TaxID=1328760 RepID=A0A165HYB2_XYLHT|nr:hypothetical protein L228DRAFT_266455 [Xylona heveae TC161]KZF24095.1 hypothetical protein L228DRAFT_266455 [Xylona heveae TC161]
MPSKFSLFKSNRSQASLTGQPERGDDDDQLRQTLPPESDAAPARWSPGFPQLGPRSPLPNTFPNPSPTSAEFDLLQTSDYIERTPRTALPTRSQSQRYSRASYKDLSLSAAEDPFSRSTQDPDSSTHPTEQKRSKRSFFGLGHHSSSASSSKESSPLIGGDQFRQGQTSTPSHHNTALGRSVSLRRRDGRSPQIDSGPFKLQQARIPPRASSRLPAPGEVDEHEDLDHYLTKPPQLQLPPSNEDYANQGFYRQQPPRLDTEQAYQDQQRQQPREHSTPDSPERYRQLQYQQDLPQQHRQASFQSTLSNTQTHNPHRTESPAYQQRQDIILNRHRSQLQQYQAYDPQLATQPLHQQPGPPTGLPPQSRQSPELSLPNMQSGQTKENSNLQPFPQGSQGVSQPPTPGLSPFGTPSTPAPQGQIFRGTVQQQVTNEQGREAAQSRSNDGGNGDVAQLADRHAELQAKYLKVKKLFFDRGVQIQQLQNVIANQRMSLSRTSLDDNEYATRFNRLDGAINNFSFNIRKDWKLIPPWLQPVVSQDAIRTGTKEMTTIGRTFISHWIYNEVFDRHFHPAIEPSLSTQLKIIEKNLWRFAPPAHSKEEEEAITSRIANWRFATIDGLRESLNAPAIDYKAQLTTSLVEKLTASLQMNLNDPPPPGLEGGISMIIELAIGIASNLPLESRDIYVKYFMPGNPITQELMRIETSLPSLQGSPSVADALASEAAGNEKASASGTETSTPLQRRDSGTSDAESASLKGETPSSRKKGGILGGLMNKKSSQQSTHSSSPSSSSGQAAGTSEAKYQTSNAGLNNASHASQSSSGSSTVDKEGGGAGNFGSNESQKVRFSPFMAIGIRGKGVLVQAPVFV